MAVGEPGSSTSHILDIVHDDQTDTDDGYSGFTAGNNHATV